ncbi:amidohydrolase 2 [Rhizorhabdus wittichii RW1]|uniref:Amidohydrolase 2 n=1 Tax=Rhizorhabdus wittichii (strain DSM 6014 / CCUG 31198 / JCM 15750 / NBRC 105917 / EY 4224 / RW1) TaxID=392499 RepID=A0A9J9HBU7_RHIWR|nr:amidohydrolase 2 [Rhizorhabdus wittichii RW1]
MTDAMLHRCSPQAAPVALGTPVARLPFRTIDLHCHLAAPEVEALVAGHPLLAERAGAEAAAIGAASLAVNRERIGALMPRLTGADERLRDMDAMGVDVQAISPSPTQYHYWAEPDLADRIVGRMNDAIATACAAHPDRFVGLGTVALQHPERAAAQLETAMRDHGFKGVEISSLVDGVDIADRRFDPFWAKADELGAVVLIHPWGTTLGDRLADHYLMNIVGQPFETALCLSKLIFGGTLDRHRRLRIVTVHGGGYLPTYVGRSDHGHAVRPEAGGCSCAPSEQLKRIWFDSLVYEPRHLARLIDEVGVGQVVLGTDYPFDMGHYDPASVVAGLDEDSQRRILGGNAAKLLGID